MLEMPYNKITIKKLVERLGMSRQNFYRYYLSKDDILLDLLDNTLDLAYQILEGNFGSSIHDLTLMTESIEAITIPRKSLINEILSCTSEKTVFNHLHGFVRRVVGRLLRERNQQYIDHDYLDLVISQHTGYGFHLAKAWAQTDNEIDPVKIRELIFSFLESLFKAVDRAIIENH